MKAINYIIIFSVSVNLLMSSCSENKVSKESTSVETEEEGHQEGLELTTEQLNAVGIQIGSIEQRNLSEVVKASGQLAVPPQNKADINVISGGIVRRINIIEGQFVNKGQALATIENQELIRIQQDYLAARNNFTFVQAEYDRQTQLKAANAGTGKSFQQAQANFNAEKDRITAYERQLQQLGVSARRISTGNIVSQFPLIAPISGTVGKILIKTGSFVQPGTAITDITDNSRLHSDLLVYEKDLSKISIGQRVNYQLTNQEGFPISGEINGINKSFENDSKGVTVHATVQNPTKKTLIPGMYVSALINVSSKVVPAIPVTGVVTSVGKSFIFIVEEEDKAGAAKKAGDPIHFRMVEVATGLSELGYIQITPLEELPKDSKVVTKGAFYLQSKAAGGSEEGH